MRYNPSFFHGPQGIHAEHDMEDELESRPSCPTPCASPPPAKGQFSGPNRKGHRWFTPEYRQYPANHWHLAKVVRDRMLGDGLSPGRGLPSENQIRQAIQAHPCNKHFTAVKPMFMPRFGPDRCTGSGSYYGSIYIPFSFDGHTPSKSRSVVHPELGQGMALPSLSPQDLCNVAKELRSCAVQPTRSCFSDRKDERVLVTDTTRIPNRWICEIILVFSEPLRRGKLWAFAGGSGLLISPSHVLTSAHLLHQRIDFGSLGGVQRTAIAAVILLGAGSKTSGVRSFPFTPILQKNADAFLVPEEWIHHLRGANNEPSRYDYAVISLAGSTACGSKIPGAAPVFPEGFWGKTNSLTRVGPQMRGFRYDKLKDLEVRIAGYPGDFPCMQWTTSGNLLGLGYGGSRSGRPHYKRTARHDILTHDLDSASGMSGSPVWGRVILKGKNGTRREERVLVGVHSRCGQAAAITPYVWEKHIQQWMKKI